MRTELKEKLYVAESRLELYLNAEKAILASQSYEIEGQKLTHANLKDVTNMINSLIKEITTLEAKIKGRKRFRVVRPGW